MKKFFCIILSLFLLFGNSFMTNAANKETIITESIEYLEDGSYFVTTIQTTSTNTLFSAYASTSATSTSTCTGSKTVTYNSSSGEKLWSVTVKGSFSYVKGSNSTCTNSSVSTAVYSSSWKITGSSSSKSGNTARATATGTHYIANIPLASITETVTLTWHE